MQLLDILPTLCFPDHYCLLWLYTGMNVHIGHLRIGSIQSRSRDLLSVSINKIQLFRAPRELFRFIVVPYVLHFYFILGCWIVGNEFPKEPFTTPLFSLTYTSAVYSFFVIWVILLIKYINLLQTFAPHMNGKWFCQKNMDYCKCICQLMGSMLKNVRYQADGSSI